MSLLSSIGKTLTGVLDTLSGVVANPITAITKGVPAAVTQFKQDKPITTAVKTITNLGVIAAGVVGISEPALAAGAAKALIPKSTVGKLAAAATIPFAVGAVSKSPAKAAQAILTTPSSLANVGVNVANLASNPSLSNFAAIYKENPVTAGILTAGGASLALGGIGLAANTAATFMNTKATNQNTIAPSDMLIDTPVGETSAIGTTLSTSQDKPSIPQTQTISTNATGTTKKRKKRKAKTIQQNRISQKVNVLVSNRNINKAWKS